MKFETFQAGQWHQRYQYKSFEPVLVNNEWVWEDPTINTLLEAANRALGELNAFSLIVPDIDLFIQMHVVKEAQTSSRIEGTQTGIDEALMPEEHIQPEKRDDWREVRNYVEAVNMAIGALATVPLSFSGTSFEIFRQRQAEGKVIEEEERRRKEEEDQQFVSWVLRDARQTLANPNATPERRQKAEEAIALYAGPETAS